MLIGHGIQHVRTHVDVTHPSLTAMRAMLEVKEEIKDKVEFLQVSISTRRY